MVTRLIIFLDGIGNNDATSLQRLFKQHSSSSHNQSSLSSLLPRTPKDVTLTPLTTVGNSVIDVSDCHQEDNDNGGIVDDKMLFAGLSVSELTSVENVEDGITSNSMSTLFSEQKIDSDTTNPSVSTIL